MGYNEASEDYTLAGIFAESAIWKKSGSIFEKRKDMKPLLVSCPGNKVKKSLGAV
jgi:hypothetical protein